MPDLPASSTLDAVRRLWAHAVWADRRLLAALPAAGVADAAEAELAHVIGAEEVWLARLERREPRAAVWPELPRLELEHLMLATHAAYDQRLGALGAEDLATPVPYSNSAGRVFESAVADILLHVALHGQYHRGKVNMLLRQAGLAPAPTDFIAFVRGVAAATRAGPGSA